MVLDFIYNSSIGQKAKMTEIKVSLGYRASPCLKKLKLIKRGRFCALKALRQGKKEPRDRDATQTSTSADRVWAVVECQFALRRGED